MSNKSAYIAKARFHVCYRVVAVHGKKVDEPRWRDYYGRKFTWRAANEEVEVLSSTMRFSGDAEYQYKALHEKVMKGEK